MSNVDLKNKVLERLETVEEAYVLEEILNLIKMESIKDEVFEIPEEHKADLEISLKQKNAGQTVPNEVVKQRIEKWLYR